MSLPPALSTLGIHFLRLWQSCKYLFRMFQSFEEGVYHLREELKCFGCGWNKSLTFVCTYSNIAACFFSCTPETCCPVCFSKVHILVFSIHTIPLLSCQLSESQIVIVLCVSMAILMSSVQKVIPRK